MKRILDMTIAGPFILMLGPVMIVLAVLVRVLDGKPVLFRQRRVGKDGRIFEIVKFRTMSVERNRNGSLLSDSERVTNLGRFLRATSMDELPSLWNVVKGDMSLVGPRPLLEEYLNLYSSRQNVRHSVKPGLTGWAQVNGRNSTSWEERFELDIWYVQNRTVMLDFLILFRTIGVVLSRKGIGHAGETTMPLFTGSPPRGD